MNTRRERLFNSLVRAIEENPVVALGVAGASASGILSGAAKLVNARTASKNSKTYRMETKRRMAKKS